MKLSEILRAGKANIETFGWCQGDEESIFGKSGKCCAATAMKPSELQPSLEYDARNAALRLFEKVNGLEECGIAAWNDVPERTKAEVLAAYDKAIAAAEAQERAA